MCVLSQHALRDMRIAYRTAFLPFICAGDPDLETTAEALRYLSEISSVIELGVPYSVIDHTLCMRAHVPRSLFSFIQDPLADGPVIHGAATRALQQGLIISNVFSGS